MDDPAFPDSHYTGTTTATTTTTTTMQSPPLTVDVGYVKSLPGILRIAEIIVNFIYWIMLAACCCYLGFPLSMAIVSWIFTILFFVVFLLQINKRVTIIHWVLTELLHDVGWAVLHFICACIVASRASLYWYSTRGCTSFAAVLGFALCILYGVSAFLNLRLFLASGGLSQLRSGASGGGATTTTVTTSEYTYDKEPGTAPPSYTNP